MKHYKVELVVTASDTKDTEYLDYLARDAFLAKGFDIIAPTHVYEVTHLPGYFAPADEDGRS